MVALRPFVYVHFARLDGFVEVSDVASAKDCIREMYPEVVFSSWQRVGDADVMVAWADAKRRVRHLLGEENRKTEPDAYVICQAWPLDLVLPSEAMGRPMEPGIRA